MKYITKYLFKFYINNNNNNNNNDKDISNDRLDLIAFDSNVQLSNYAYQREL